MLSQEILHCSEQTVAKIQFWLDHPSLDLPRLGLNSRSAELLQLDIEHCRALLQRAGKRPTDVLGAGSFGIVFRAYDETLKREVAVKVLRPSAVTSPRNLARFSFEAESLAKCECDGILPIYECGEIDGSPYLTTQLIQGASLADYLGTMDSPLTDRLAATLLAQVAQAVHYMHNRGFIHRDLKPSNILLAENDTNSGDGLPFRPLVTDFGFVKEIDERLSAHSEETSIVGTVKYMAPEQAKGERDRISISTDVYALGTILYEMVTLQCPHLASSKFEMLAQIIQEDPISPRTHNRQLSKELEAIILHCLEKEPTARYASARELTEDLYRFLKRQPTLARPAGPLRKLTMTVRRHPFLFLIWCILLGLLLATTAFYQRSQELVQELGDANETLIDKNQELLRADQLNREFIEFASDAYRDGVQQFAELLSLFAKGADTRARLHGNALKYFLRLAEVRGHDQFSRHQLSIAYHFLADSMLRIEDTAAALEARVKCIELLRPLMAELPENANLRNDMFNNLRMLGYQQPEQKMQHWLEARVHIEKAVELEPSNVDWKDCHNAIISALAEGEMDRQNLAASRQLATQTIAASEALWEQFPDKPDYRKYAATGWRTLAFVDSAEGDIDSMVANFKKALMVQGAITARHGNFGSWLSDECQMRVTYVDKLHDHRLHDELQKQLDILIPQLDRAIIALPENSDWPKQRTRMIQMRRELTLSRGALVPGSESE